MAIQITNNTTTIDIDFIGNGDKYSIHKANITLEKSDDTVVIVDSGRVPAKEYKVLYSNVTVPANTDADDLYSILLGYINTTSGGGGGDASAANQLTQIARQDTIIGHVDGLEALLTSLDGKDYATQTTLALVKTALDTLNAKDYSTETTLSALKLVVDSLEAKDFATSTKQEDIKTKLDAETIISNSSRVTLNDILKEQRLTNKLLNKIYNPE
jgi:hypothetical protein